MNKQERACARLFNGSGFPEEPSGFFPPISARKLIGLTGRARSGKDTVGGMLKEAFGVKTLAFASPLKEGLKTMLNLTDEHVHGSLKETVMEDFGKSPRQMLQTLGTDWGRHLVNDSIWLVAAKRQIRAWMEDGQHVVMTDVRFNNEAILIREMGGTVWHVRRDTAQRVNEHASEAGVDVMPEDVVLYNNSSLNDLYDSVVDEF